jgi:hypothetical protein
MLRLTIPTEEDAAFVVVPMVAIRLKSTKRLACGPTPGAMWQIAH